MRENWIVMMYHNHMPLARFVDFQTLCVCVLQLAQDEGSPVRGFAVVEYETAEQAEAVLLEMDRQLIQGQEIRLSLCPPGTSGRSTLAALIATQGVVSDAHAHGGQVTFILSPRSKPRECFSHIHPEALTHTRACVKQQR